MSLAGAAGLAQGTAKELEKWLMKFRSLGLCLIVAVPCITAAAIAENPFAGTWKVDYSKSHVTGQTISFDSEAGGAVRFTEPNENYTFKPDGTDTKNTFGDTVQWKQTDDHTWKESPKRNLWSSLTPGL